MGIFGAIEVLWRFREIFKITGEKGVRSLMVNFFKSLFHWFKVFLSGNPHFTVGPPEKPYLLRWYLVPRNHLCNFYLHRFLSDDDDRALHDHPWWFISFVLWGAYLEHCSDRARVRRAGSIAFRPASHRHRIELIEGKTCWTLIVTGPKSRVWGFWCPQGFVPFYEFHDGENPGQAGKGCG